ncbi:uncharacterized protein MELLADRAFT_93555 [Melampsora larici-populina 98AG31]|uniref:CxC1-like cysteine cluster associated with KDZ transposases domain-containing protein n=1 Tax=Melampsora larici-populina (strain 98AG31 / pathotype 3-4-7) TaxID=747676 RepID=F4RAU6_MELLP|nr:uncharacterized protein MELLADRAFT_93555 [Melampsora larici-populina 98AG31]EGG10716.1 hypothetical protein MELLADRAFT_93555 [Melampsora larici-populina 98AG31]
MLISQVAGILTLGISTRGQKKTLGLRTEVPKERGQNMTLGFRSEVAKGREGVHQAFKPGKPYWLGKPKTDAQARHFARMAEAVKSRKPKVPALTNAYQLPQDDFGHNAAFMQHNPYDQDEAEHRRIPTPEFIEDIRRARLEDERQARALALEAATQEMFVAYIECHLLTAEWGDPSKWDLDHKPPQCDCQAHRVRFRRVDLVDILFITTSPSDRRKAEIRFCGCQTNDNTRLIYMGYVGGSPKFPETAFSIRLLRFFHIVWKYCTSRVDPFTRALDEFLDAFNPLILTKNEEPRRWHTPFRWAIDAYRKMLTATETALNEEMSLSPQEKLAENCPRCFGAPVPSTIESEPDVIVCLDGNFQHRRHIVAGQQAGRTAIKMPSTFLPQSRVTQMENRLAGIPENDAVSAFC